MLEVILGSPHISAESAEFVFGVEFVWVVISVLVVVIGVEFVPVTV